VTFSEYRKTVVLSLCRPCDDDRIWKGLHMSYENPESDSLPHVTITTDGAARGNPGPGGWAALLQMEKDDKIMEKLVTGQEESITTNNAMEIQAVIGGLETLKRPCEVTLRIDSIYVINGIKRIQAGQAFQVGAKNDDRWTQLAEVMRGHAITCEWVKGHAGDTRNERVDTAATQAAEQAYEKSERSQQPPGNDNFTGWTLAICSSGNNRPVQWSLLAEEAIREGEVHVLGMTEATAVWQGLIDGLRSAQELGADQQVNITIQSNYELIVKQGRGEWKVKNPAQQPLAARLAILRTKLGDLRFEYMKTEDIRRRIELTD
jgi:ribonuclease HI